MLYSITWIISSGIVAILLLLKTSVQWALDFSFSRTPFFSRLKPMLVIYGVIFTIAASRRFRHRDQDDPSDGNDRTDHRDHSLKEDLHQSTFRYEEIADGDGFGGTEFAGTVVYEEEMGEAGVGAIKEEKKTAVEERGLGGSGGGEFRISTRINSPEIPNTATGLSEEQNDTMEDTWKMITEGRSKPLPRHIKKSDTWQESVRQMKAEPSRVKKSETFKDRNNLQPCLDRIPTWLKLRKEPSLSPDELNRRVEAFIKKFNEDMRLQRLESLKRYKDLLRRGI